jgi:hypothetical protein
MLTAPSSPPAILPPSCATRPAVTFHGVRDDQYSQCMALQQNARRQRNVIFRIARWKPASYRQVWLVSAPLMASAVLTGGLVAALSGGGFAAYRLLLSVPVAVVAFAAQGAVDSYRLGRRRDAMTYKEWLESRGRSGAG